MSQRSFASAEYAMKKKHTRRDKFLADMERVVPWSRLIAETCLRVGYTAGIDSIVIEIGGPVSAW